MISTWIIMGFYLGLLIASLWLSHMLSMYSGILNFYRKLPLYVKNPLKFGAILFGCPIIFTAAFGICGMLIEKISNSQSPQIDIVLKGLWPLVTTGITGYIAYQQYNLNKQNTKFNLYNKRFSIYRRVVEILSKVARIQTVHKEQIMDYVNLQCEAKFLFDIEVNDRLNEIYEKMIALQRLSVATKKWGAELDSLIYPFMAHDYLLNLEYLGSENSLESLFYRYLAVKGNI